MNTNTEYEYPKSDIDRDQVIMFVPKRFPFVLKQG